MYIVHMLCAQTRDPYEKVMIVAFVNLAIVVIRENRKENIPPSNLSPLPLSGNGGNFTFFCQLNCTIVECFTNVT